MKRTLLEQVCKLTLITGVLLVSSSFVDKPSQAQESDRESFCQRFPQNSNCQNEVDAPETTKTTTEQVDWDSLCQKFPLNSRCQAGRPETIKIPLASSGAKDEWIRIEKTGDKVKLLHTRESDGGLLSKALNGAAGAAIPLPIPNLKLSQWSDHQTTSVTFKPDSCQASPSNKALQKHTASCVIAGTDSLVLPKGSDIYAGLFTIEYTEGDLARSITFRVPSPKQE
jgi:hypothetical protein